MKSASDWLSGSTTRRKADRHDRLRQFGHTAHVQSPAVEKRPAAVAGRITFAADWVENRAGQHLAGVLQSDRDGILGNAMDVIRRAVERIDDPAKARRLARAWRQPARPLRSRKSWSGNASSTIRRTASCDAKSASVTRSDGTFFVDAEPLDPIAATPLRRPGPPARILQENRAFAGRSCRVNARRGQSTGENCDSCSRRRLLIIVGSPWGARGRPAMNVVASRARPLALQHTDIVHSLSAKGGCGWAEKYLGKCWTSPRSWYHQGYGEGISYHSWRHSPSGFVTALFNSYSFQVLLLWPLLCSGPAAPRKWTAGFFCRPARITWYRACYFR